MIRALSPIFGLLALAWWRWALRELSTHNPLHPDLPVVLHRVRELEARFDLTTNRRPAP